MVFLLKQGPVRAKPYVLSTPPLMMAMVCMAPSLGLCSRKQRRAGRQRFAVHFTRTHTNLPLLPALSFFECPTGFVAHIKKTDCRLPGSRRDPTQEALCRVHHIERVLFNHRVNEAERTATPADQVPDLMLASERRKLLGCVRAMSSSTG